MPSAEGGLPQAVGGKAGIQDCPRAGGDPHINKGRWNRKSGKKPSGFLLSLNGRAHRALAAGMTAGGAIIHQAPYGFIDKGDSTCAGLLVLYVERDPLRQICMQGALNNLVGPMICRG